MEPRYLGDAVYVTAENELISITVDSHLNNSKKIYINKSVWDELKVYVKELEYDENFRKYTKEISNDTKRIS